MPRQATKPPKRTKRPYSFNSHTGFHSDNTREAGWPRTAVARRMRFEAEQAFEVIISPSMIPVAGPFNSRDEAEAYAAGYNKDNAK